MADVIEFLERMGRDAQLRHASGAALEQALRAAQMSPREQAALLAGDRAAIEAVIGAEGNVCCVVFVPWPVGDDQEPEAPETRRQKAA